MSDKPVSRIRRLSADEFRPQKISLKLPPGLSIQLENAAHKAELTPEQWLVSAAFEKLRRELYRQPKNSQRRKRLGTKSAKSTPDFFLKTLRQHNRTQKNHSDKSG
jgi:hypothetical protein